MTEAPAPTIHSKPRRRISWVWLVPLLAAVAGVVLLIRSYAAQGPTLTISFDTATGISAGKTEVRYKDVVVGKVTDVQLGSNANVLVTASLRNSATRLAVADSRFWVVRPRFDTSGISGLGTVLSGAYIGVDAGSSNEKQRRFVGLETPPPVTQDQKGSRFKLVGDQLGSLDAGSPVYYRHLEAGQVVKYELDERGEKISMELFIREPFNRYVTRQTRFWNASGIDISVTGGSVSLETQSLTTILLGGLAFGNPPGMDSRAAVPPDENQVFTLFNAREVAMQAAPQGDSITVEFLFEQSIDGLSRGADVQFLGVIMGKVSSVKIDYLADQQRFYGIATADLIPQKLGPAYYNLLGSIDDSERNIRSLLKMLIEQGLRAQLQSANLLTGQQQIVLSMKPGSALQSDALASSSTLRIPTVPGTLDAMQVQVATLLNKLQQLPIEELGEQFKGILADARATISRLEQQLGNAVTTVSSDASRTMRTARVTMNKAENTFVSLNDELLPTASQAMKQVGSATEKVSVALENTIGDDDAVLLNELRGALQETERALRSVRNLADSIKRNPQQIILGKDDPANPFGNQPRGKSTVNSNLRATLNSTPQEPQYSGPKR